MILWFENDLENDFKIWKWFYDLKMIWKMILRSENDFMMWKWFYDLKMILWFWKMILKSYFESNELRNYLHDGRSKEEIEEPSLKTHQLYIIGNLQKAPKSQVPLSYFNNWTWPNGAISIFWLIHNGNKLITMRHMKEISSEIYSIRFWVFGGFQIAWHLNRKH